MSARLLRFTSPILYLRVADKEIEAFSTTFDGWTISESYGGATQFYEGEPYWAYQVTIERESPPEVDLGNDYIQGCHLAQDLDRVWTYSTGLPLSPPGFDIFLPPVNPPPGWTSNGSIVVPGEDWSILQSREPSRHTHLTLPRLPLKASVHALEAYYQADELTAQLCSFHFGSLTTTEPDLHFLLLAQGLEIARELLPGPDANAKQNVLPSAVQKALKRGLNWLFEASHRRRQTRHSITKVPTLGLHPPLDESEERDFIHDSLLVLQAVAAARLGLPLVINSKGVSSEAA
jgi:hypothetical protein